MNRFPPVDPNRCAIVVIDMQRAFVGPQALFPNPVAASIIPPINRLVDFARDAGASICWSRHAVLDETPARQPDWQRFDGSLSSLSAPALKPGAPLQSLHPDLHCDPNDLVFDKYRFSCFVNASLDFEGWLRDRGIEDVFIVGTISNCCCESTARDAAMRDFRVRFVEDATAALTDEEHDAALLSVCAIVGEVVDTEQAITLVSIKRQ
jgi:nicotinamidase-related amidase